MANANVARGLVPYRHFDGSVWNGSANIYYVSASYATSIFVGDPVIMKSSQNDANGIPAVQVASAGTSNLVLGSMVGIVTGGNPVISVTRDLSVYRPASTAQYILVADDPTLLFYIQDDGSGSTLNQWPGQNGNLIATGSGNTQYGFSGWNLQGSSVTTTSTLQLKIMRLLDQPDNAQPPTVNAKWLVKINQHQLVGATAGN